MSSNSSSEAIFDKEEQLDRRLPFPITPRTSYGGYQDDGASPGKSQPTSNQGFPTSQSVHEDDITRFEDIRGVTKERNRVFHISESDENLTELRHVQTPHLCPIQGPGYAAAMEERLKALERQLRDLVSSNSKTSEVVGNPEHGKVEGPPRRVILDTEPHWMKWKEYLLPTTRTPKGVLEVLTEKPHTKRRRVSLAPPPKVHESTSTSMEKSEHACRHIERIRVRSPHVISVLQQISQQTFDSTSCLVMLRPYKLLLLYKYAIKDHLGELESKQSGVVIQFEGVYDTGNPKKQPECSTPQQEAISHLRCLVNFMENDMRDIFAQHRHWRSENAETIDFTNVWHLFAAGDLVTTDGQNDQQIYRVSIMPAADLYSSRRPVKEIKETGPDDDDANQEFEAVYAEQPSIATMLIDCFYFDYNGEKFGPVEKRFDIMSFEGEKKITDLPVYPLRFRKDAAELQSRMLTRGKRFRDLCDVAHREYNGLSLMEPREQIDSQVIIDMALAYRNDPQSAPSFGLTSWIEDGSRIVAETCGILGCMECFKGRLIFDDHRLDRHQTLDFTKANSQLLTPVEIEDRNMLSDDQLLLFPRRMHGFVLRSRKWLSLDIDKIVPIRRREEGFQSLVLPPNVRYLVEGLVQSHSSGTKPTMADAEQEDHQVDLVRGKGKGLIILLHGAPGVGKTSTAECVADYTHRPLFPLTCGDIGETAKEVESNLEQNFSLAHRWGCVLLLDEADVFLQARDKEDMRRNSVVSVFLRVLEYYSGILFLTSNKVGHFDEAFKSRIHVSLHYPPLDKKATVKVWKMNLQRVLDKKKGLGVDRDAITQYAKQHYRDLFHANKTTWNGRQIKNAFQTAIALAEFDAKTKQQAKAVLTKEHFEIVAKASAGFDEYLCRIHGNDADRARREGQRDDDPRDNWPVSKPKKLIRNDESTSSSSDDSDAQEKRRKKEEKKKRKKAKAKGKSGRSMSTDVECHPQSGPLSLTQATLSDSDSSSSG